MTELEQRIFKTIVDEQTNDQIECRDDRFIYTITIEYTDENEDWVYLKNFEETMWFPNWFPVKPDREDYWNKETLEYKPNY